MVKLFDAHCHLQDPRIFKMAPQLIKTALDSGVAHLAVNGVSEKDWHLVKQMSEENPCVIPCFGIHPWYLSERSPDWLNVLKGFFEAVPSAAVGEIGIDKGSHGRGIDFGDQVQVFQEQLELAKELKRPASIHCVRAFGNLLPILKSVGPFPSGFLLHSYMGSAEMVPEFAALGAYFSFSGFIMSLKENKAKKMLKSVPRERILLETDSPEALPKSMGLDSLFPIERDDSNDESSDLGDNPTSNNSLNHPANIHTVLAYVASLLDMSKEELADISYENAMHLFSFEGSKVVLQS